MNEREANPLRIFFRNPTVRGVVGGGLMLFGCLGAGYGVLDYANIFSHSIKQDAGQEMDKRGLPPPESWEQAYKEFIKEDQSNRVKAVVDYFSVLGGAAFLISGYYRTKNRRGSN